MSIKQAHFISPEVQVSDPVASRVGMNPSVQLHVYPPLPSLIQVPILQGLTSMPHALTKKTAVK